MRQSSFKALGQETQKDAVIHGICGVLVHCCWVSACCGPFKTFTAAHEPIAHPQRAPPMLQTRPLTARTPEHVLQMLLLIKTGLGQARIMAKMERRRSNRKSR